LAFESKSSPSPQEIGLESDLSPSPGLESYNSGYYWTWMTPNQCRFQGIVTVEYLKNLGTELL